MDVNVRSARLSGATTDSSATRSRRPRTPIRLPPGHTKTNQRASTVRQGAPTPVAITVVRAAPDTRTMPGHSHRVRMPHLRQSYEDLCVRIGIDEIELRRLLHQPLEFVVVRR